MILRTCVIPSKQKRTCYRYIRDFGIQSVRKIVYRMLSDVIIFSSK